MLLCSESGDVGVINPDHFAAIYRFLRVSSLVAGFEGRHKRLHPRNRVGKGRFEIQSLDNVRRWKARQIDGGEGGFGHARHVAAGYGRALRPVFGLGPVQMQELSSLRGGETIFRHGSSPPPAR